MSYSDDDLLEEIRRVAAVANSDGAPTVTEFSEHSDIADSTIHRRFGSWNEGVAAAGFDPNPPETEISTEDLIDELHRVRDELGHTPTVREMNDAGNYWVSTYRNHFGSWVDALVTAFDDIESVDALNPEQTAGQGASSPHAPGRPQQHTDDELIAELRRLAAEQHDPPRIQDVREHSERGVKTYYRRFGSWTDALDASGFESTSGSNGSARVSADELIADLHRLRDELGERPTSTDVAREGEHGLATYQRRFGSWGEAAAVAFEASSDTTGERSE